MASGSSQRGHLYRPQQRECRRQSGGRPVARITGLAIHDQTFDGAVTGRRWKIYRPFVEDNWRVTPALTLNLGVAWDMTTPITEADGRMANYIPATGQLLIANQNGVSASAGVKMDWTALEPRVGATWKVFGSERRCSAPVMPYTMTLPGVRALRVCGKTRPFLGESDAFASAGCAFAPHIAPPYSDKRPPA